MTANHVLDMMINGTRCPFWMESRDARCGSTKLIDGRWCKRHTAVMARRLEKQAAQEAAYRREERRRAMTMLPRWRERLAWVEAEINRLDPPPPTTDMAAFGGVGSTTATRYRKRFLANLPRLAELSRERDDLLARIVHAEAMEAQP